MIISQFSKNLQKELDKCSNTNSVFNYVNLLSSIDNSLCEIAKSSLKTIIEALDNSYCNSIDRKAKYHVKAHFPRTMLTVFGEITFVRRFYSNKDNKGSFCFVDRFLGLNKNDYFDPYIKATIIEYSANNSIPKVCTMLNELIGNRISLNSKTKYLNRQTCRNIILSALISTPEKNELDTPDTLLIIADEKWVPTQNNDGKKVMVKSIVVFDKISGIKRRFLCNKRIFASFENGLIDEVLDYIYYTYDTDKIKNIIVMGDGALWIKNLTSHFKFNKDTKIMYALDKFHYKQAIHHICQNTNMEKTLSSYVINNKKKDFIEFVDTLLETNQNRTATIENKKEYILSNWQYILNLYENKLSCPMESQISHNLACLLTSRPKAYSLEMLKIIINLRLLFKNKENIKMLYLNNFNKKEIVEINKDTLNLCSLKENNLYNPFYKFKSLDSNKYSFY